MKKYLKIVIPIVCVLVVIITFYMIFDIRNKVEEVNYGTNDIEVENVVNEDDDENIVDENVVEDDNTEEPTNETTNNTDNNTTTNEEVSNEDDVFSKNKLEQAKELVKKAWGKDDTIYLTNEGMTSDGLYMVAVRDKTSTAVKNYFKVNIETKKVEVDY